nr:MAG TPA: hypothetical protein [Caudoviricetes sp.]
MNIFYKYFNTFYAEIAHNKKRWFKRHLSYVNFDFYKTKIIIA